MFDISIIPAEEKERIESNLRRWGIEIDPKTGKAEYIKGTSPIEMKCASIHLIRHVETVAVKKQEFMSDTSSNCVFTESGIETTRRQAKELDAYGFDIALYGPIERVVNTQKLIMETPQKFECVQVPYLHGINNTGWEYKNFFELENDPVFVAREIDNNMFARTPEGSSWGTVVANCAEVLELINEKYVGKKILLISQGSVLRGMEILLRKREHPWDGYGVQKMYNVGGIDQKKTNYGVISEVYSASKKN